MRRAILGMRTAALAVLFSFAVVSLISCGKIGIDPVRGDGDENQALPIERQVASYVAPAGVDAAVFGQLKNALIAALANRSTSALPPGDAGKVTDLVYNISTQELTWSYKNKGDYDLNGQVGVSDITPIALHYLASTTDGAGDDALEAWIDGDGNGQIGVSDVTPIAQNYLSDVAAYRVFTCDTEDGEFSQLGGDVPFGTAGEFPKEYSLPLPEGALAYIEIAPVDSDGNAGAMSAAVGIGFFKKFKQICVIVNFTWLVWVSFKI